MVEGDRILPPRPRNREKKHDRTLAHGKGSSSVSSVADTVSITSCSSRGSSEARPQRDDIQPNRSFGGFECINLPAAERLSRINCQSPKVGENQSRSRSTPPRSSIVNSGSSSIKEGNDERSKRERRERRARSKTRTDTNSSFDSSLLINTEGEHALRARRARSASCSRNSSRSRGRSNTRLNTSFESKSPRRPQRSKSQDPNYSLAVHAKKSPMSQKRARSRSRSQVRLVSIDNPATPRSARSQRSQRSDRSQSSQRRDRSQSSQRRDRSQSSQRRDRSRSRSSVRNYSADGPPTSIGHGIIPRTLHTDTILPDEIEPNVHHDAIQTQEVDNPVIKEMKENELFAREAGINFSRHGGDYLTILDPQLIAQNEMSLNQIELSPRHSNRLDDDRFAIEEEDLPPNATFLQGHRKKNMIDSEQDLAQLRLLAGHLSIEWRGKKFIAPALARRLRDFQFAQEKRRKKFGNERPWGILGLYDHLAAVRMDVEWAEDAACRRANCEPYHAWVDFVGEKKTGYNRPFFTYLTLILCTGFLLCSVAINGWSVEPLSINPMIGPSADTLVRMGAKESYLIVNESEVWRLVTPIVLHAGLIHYFLNMLALWFIGSAIEQCHGFFPAFILFFVPAVGGTILSGIFLPNYISVGASGGIFGLIGACLADIVMNWQLLFSDFVNEGNKNRHTIILVCLFLDIVVNCVIGLTPFVDNFTHLGGMIFGFLCGISTMERVYADFLGGVEKRNCWTATKKIFLRFFGIIVSVAGIMIGMALLFEGDGVTTPCESCKVLSCVSFPPWKSNDSKWWYCDDCGGVTADARINPNTGEFDQLSIHCPAGSIAVVDLIDDMKTDKHSLETNLPKICRKHCLGELN